MAIKTYFIKLHFIANIAHLKMRKVPVMLRGHEKKMNFKIKKPAF